VSRSTRLRWTIAVAIGVVAVGLVVLSQRFGRDAEAVGSNLLNRTAPTGELERLDGPGSLDLADLRGSRVVVNFWASWCQPCREEHRDLVRIADDYRDRGVRVVGVVFQDDAADARAFLLRFGDGYDTVLDSHSRTAIDFGIFGVPETFYLDEDGVVRGNVAGPVDYAAVAAALDRMGVDAPGRVTSPPGPTPAPR
jgi:cytochrome c biogenesis protein CcmG/thiol:disulfide interchange protein DsbE